MESREKEACYRRVARKLEALNAQGDDAVVGMANTCAVLMEALPYASWVGFYRVVAPDLLRVGPYQGPPACVEIRFSRGVCGAAAREGRTQLVDDVHAFTGHIACDPRSRSEIVVPVRDRRGRVCAVLDLDSHEEAAFGEEDRVGLERVAELLAECMDPPPRG